MKYLLVLVVVGIGLWLLLRARPRVDPPKDPPRRPPAGPAAMVACAHCDLRLPQAEAQFDAQGRPYCSEAHRLAGPR
jgi:uncharacterized protein